MRLPLPTCAAAVSLALAAPAILPAQAGSNPPSPSAIAPDSMTAPAAKGVIHPSAQAVQPLKAGDPVPAIEALKDEKGDAADLAALLKGRTTVLVFYRGGWCPYCNAHLAELAKIQPELTARGVQLIAVSADSPESLAAYTAEHKLPYTLLSDGGHAAMKAFGVAFAVDEGTQQKYKGYGIDLAAVTGNPEVALPVPSVFVINPEGRITFAHANADYTKRLSGAEVMEVVGAAEPKPAKQDAAAEEPAGK